MAKQSDRASRLVVTGLALCLTLVSSATFVIQPSSTHHGLRSLPERSTTSSPVRTLTAPSSVEKDVPAASNAQAHTVQPVTRVAGAYSNPLDSLLHLTPIVQNGIPVVVVGVGRDTPASAVTMVKSLIQKYQIVATDAHTLGLTTGQTIYIYLAQSQSDYNQALRKIGLSIQQAQSLSIDTGGFTQGSTVLVPLFQNTAEADLANTLGHELTHAILNANVSQLPSWINEGIAVTNGMNTQNSQEGTVAYGGYARRMAVGVLDAVNQGQLMALTVDESRVLQGNPSYDLELQDWLAVSQLIKGHGTAGFTSYFNRLRAGESGTSAFQHAFGLTPDAFNTSFTRFLHGVAHTGDPGVQVTLTIPSSYHGGIRVLQHGSQLWRGVKAGVGQTTITLKANGSITSSLPMLPTRPDANPPDNTTVYVNLDPTHPLTYQGHQVKDCGFALDYHDGLYGYVNTWITLQNGQTDYIQSPSLFGVTLSSVKETVRPGTPSLVHLFNVLSSN